MKIDYSGMATESNIESAGSFTIKASALAFKILSSNLYNDKPLAILREIGCNAYDAHVLGGIPDTPITVRLPNEFSPYLEITDYGPGLSRDEYQEVYTTYFGSTKSDSNDFIGAMGLGSKSPFAYSDTFEVISRKNGIETHYCCFLDQSGAPDNYILASNDIPIEKTGITVRVPVKQNHYQVFEEAAKKAYSFFSVSPDFGIDLGPFLPDPIFSGSNFKVYPRQGSEGSTGIFGNVMVKMGQVAYPVQTGKLNTLTRDFIDRYTRYTSNRIVVEVAIGDVDVNAGREGLSYDEATIEALNKAFCNIQSELRQEIQDAVQAEETYYGALLKRTELDPQEIFNLTWICPNTGKSSDPKHLLLDFRIGADGKPTPNSSDSMFSVFTKVNLTRLTKESRPHAIAFSRRIRQDLILLDTTTGYNQKLNYATEDARVGWSYIIRHTGTPAGTRVVCKSKFVPIIELAKKYGINYRFMSDIVSDVPKKERMSNGVVARYSGFYHGSQFSQPLVTKLMKDIAPEEYSDKFAYLCWDTRSRRFNTTDLYGNKEFQAKLFHPDVWRVINKALDDGNLKLAIVANKVWDKIPKHWVNLLELISPEFSVNIDINTIYKQYGGFISGIAQQDVLELSRIVIEEHGFINTRVKSLLMDISKIEMKAPYKAIKDFYTDVYQGGDNDIIGLDSYKKSIMSAPGMIRMHRCTYSHWSKADVIDGLLIYNLHQYFRKDGETQ